MENPMQRSLAGYTTWGHNRLGHDLVTKKQQSSKDLIYNLVTTVNNTVYLRVML